jgi:hypothetical protein
MTGFSQKLLDPILPNRGGWGTHLPPTPLFFLHQARAWPAPGAEERVLGRLQAL